MTFQPQNRDPDLVAMRRRLHAIPEIGLSEFKTSDIVAAELTRLGYQVTRGLAKTGIVATLRNGDSERSIGLRADFDALPIEEQTGADYASTHPGRMHACGHDGHTAMLLGAAAMLAERRQFSGTVHLIFQPAEENFGGAKLMIEDGLFERFPCDAVFGLHNEPSLPLGSFAFREGEMMAAADECRITIIGKGGHGAEPHLAADPIVCGASIIMALQTIISRNTQASQPAVITVGTFHGGNASNVIPERAEMSLTVRALDADTRDNLEKRVRTVAEGQAASYGMQVEIDYERFYPPLINPKAETDYVRSFAQRFSGMDKVHDMQHPIMGSEDFSYFLEERPGCYFLLGTARTENDPPLHHPKYDFNDDALPIGAAFWTELVEDFLARD
ncbi:M20 aminoacylase family protein [Roseibium sp.]|uniref:M20 aminoacylase family protein n=1 Tax=Roseibium sp. TaxID=1936156 RepID=UPI003B5073FA